ncbi:MAG: SAM-dependent chlorinase/fluorinase [Propionibacteriaceae bacterium]|nr:SAM-dependent chlorinase/fluorinase [Propionibacteriaceae bacterium]
MLVQVVADYGVADLAFAEVRQLLAFHLPAVDVGYTSVGPFDTLAAGFCVGQLALGDGPRDRVVYHNVAPREDEDDPRSGNEGERLLAAWARGVLVVGADSRYAFSFIRDEVEELYEVAIPDTGSQFRSRDAFPPLLPRLLARDPAVLAEAVSPEAISGPPEGVVAYIDGYGNLKTTWADPPLEAGSTLQVRVGEVTATATVGQATFGVSVGQLAFAPGSSGWRRQDGSDVRWWELLMRGGSAAEFFHQTTTGTAVEISQ